jgi:putative nucleotidyltransferase with HDIG domain
VIYRIKQLWWAVTARPVADALVAEWLNSAEIPLFRRYTPNDQQHALRVVRHLQQINATDPSLIKAALIHDIGKTQLALTVWDRCLIVLASLLMPQRAAHWGLDESRRDSWRKPFIVKQHHARWGAEMAAAAGCDSLTIELIARHQDKNTTSNNPKTAALLERLQWADDRS